MQEKQEKSKPAHEIRLASIKAAIWKNTIEGVVRFNVTFRRLYKKDGAQWASSESFGRDDLLLLGKVADQAHTWICGAQSQDDRADQAARESAEMTSS